MRRGLGVDFCKAKVERGPQEDYRLRLLRLFVGKMLRAFPTLLRYATLSRAFNFLRKLARGGSGPHTKEKSDPLDHFFLWCGEEDLNLHERNAH